ncbi:hypothetical protein PQX77_021333 [Marasmius sp. AFHP31]|nr:hypothetical protein PQX77_021333 [Marasmius sp. AFHP31]
MTMREPLGPREKLTHISRLGNLKKAVKTPAVVPDSPSPDQVKGPANVTRKAPSKTPPALATSRKAISAAEFSEGGFEAVDLSNLKRGSEAKAQEGPLSKKHKPTESTEAAKPSLTSKSRAKPEGSIPSGQLPPLPHHSLHPQAVGIDGSSSSAPHAAATPPPLLQPPFQWQVQAPSPSNALYPMPYYPAMYGAPLPHPHAPPPAQQQPTTMHHAHPQPGASAPAPANPPPEMMAWFHAYMAQHQAGPLGYQPPPAGPGRQ